MSNQDRLLSDDELKSELHSIIIQAVIEERLLDKSDVMVYPREQQKIYMKYRNKSFDLLNTQKRLYAESVIDNAIEDIAGYQAMSNRATVTVNELMNPDAGFRAYAKDLAEQRARIKP